MIRFPCPRCGAALKAPDERAGQKVTCPECERPVPVPDPDDAPPRAERDQGPRRKFPAWAWVAVAAGVLVLVAVVLIAKSGGSQHDLTTDEGKTRWLVGEWEQREDTGDRSDFKFEASGHYRMTIRLKGRPEGWMSGMWYFEGGKLHITVRDTSDGPPQRTQYKTFEVKGASADRCTLINEGTGNGVLTRKK